MNDCNLLVFVNDLSFYKSHRHKLFSYLSIKQKISVITQITTSLDKKTLENKNLKINFMNFDRSSLNPFNNLKYFYTILKNISSFRSEKVIFISNKLIFFGSLINLLNFMKNQKFFFFFSGLGYLFISKSVVAKIIKAIFIFLLKLTSLKGNIEIVVQNQDDFNYFKKNLKKFCPVIHLIKGSGIETQMKIKKNYETIQILFAGRLLKDKGIIEFVNLAERIKAKFPKKQIEFLIAGECDYQNPNCISDEELNLIKINETVQYLGKIPYKDLCKLYMDSHIFVLPSYREGLPRVALEAGSYGMALLLSDVPGCRECVRNNFNGYLFSLSDKEDLNEKIKFLIENPHQLNQMCNNSQTFVENNFSEKIIFSKFYKVLN